MANILRRIDLLERLFVRRVVLRAQHRVLTRTSSMLNRLSTGWLYLIIAILLVVFGSRDTLIAALASVAVCYLLYWIIKPGLARLRPCDADATLPSSLKPLDRYSCPSGHCMTAAAFGVPLGWNFPVTIPVVLIALVLIGWARLAVGHHYLSDVILGVLLGGVVAVPLAAALL